MSADGPSRSRPAASTGEPASLQTATTPDMLTEQVDRLARDLAAHRWLTDRGDALAFGAALAVAHGALALATAPLSTPAEHDLRRAALDGTGPVLARAGLGHVAELIAAALALELHPVALTRDRRKPQ